MREGTGKEIEFSTRVICRIYNFFPLELRSKENEEDRAAGCDETCVWDDIELDIRLCMGENGTGKSVLVIG